MRTTKSTLAGVGSVIVGTGIAADGIHRIGNETEQTGLGAKVAHRAEVAGGGALAVDGGLRATTGQGAATWAQRVTQAAQAARAAHIQL